MANSDLFTYILLTIITLIYPINLYYLPNGIFRRGADNVARFSPMFLVEAFRAPLRVSLWYNLQWPILTLNGWALILAPLLFLIVIKSTKGRTKERAKKLARGYAVFVLFAITISYLNY